MVQIDKSLAYLRESNNASFTLLMWNFSKDELVSELKHKLALISTIKNTFKKVKLNDRLYQYLGVIEKSSIQTYSQIVLIGAQTYIYKLESSDITMLREYSIPKFTISNDEYFNIEWLIDLFENFKFYDVIINNSNVLTHYQGNLNKKKIIKQNANTDYIKSLTTEWFMVGKLMPQNKTKFMIDNLSSSLQSSSSNPDWKNIISQIEIRETNKKLVELNKHYENMAINPDKYVFGLDDITEMIFQFNIKELYIHENIKKNFYDKIVEKDLSSNINFNIITIDSIDSNPSNPSNMFLKNYSGILGIKYY